MNKPYARIILAGLMYLLLAALAAGAYMAASDPSAWDKRSPLSAAGPVTTAMSGAAASVMGGAAQWPEWMSDRDRENLDRVTKNVRAGESRKFMTSMMVFQDELEERGHGVLELKGGIIASLAGEVIATSLTPLALGAMMTIAIFWIFSVLSRAGANPMDALWKAAAFLVGAAGSLFLRFALAGLLFLLFTGVGLWLRPFPSLLYSATEGAAWLAVGLLAVWIASLTGMANAPRPRMEKCGACKGLGYLPSKSSGAGKPGPSTAGEDNPGHTIVINAD
ncbi:MAG: hypothetical protein OEV92_01505 [Nitrospinota bacterium]|nr:hypothetical protein [Nitrospinota bacterium]